MAGRRRQSEMPRRITDVKRPNESKKSNGVSILNDEPWIPGGYTAFKILMSARLCAALWNGINDCDETYNYWEPMHFILFGSGFQTWEYSPVYAIRSYAYLALHSFPLRIYNIVNVNKIFLFYFLRCILGIICALAELYFYKGVCRQFGAKIGQLMLWLMLFSTGMFIACSSFLPSSFSMYLTMVAMGAWFLNNTHIAILAVAASAIIGWPFSAALGIPIACDILVRQKKTSYFIYWCVIALVIFLVSENIGMEEWTKFMHHLSGFFVWLTLSVFTLFLHNLPLITEEMHFCLPNLKILLLTLIKAMAFIHKAIFLIDHASQVPVVIIDSYYYDKLVIAPLNIIMYNIFTEHGPNIYGVEPFSFYFLNGFLNFNVAFLFAFLCLPISLLLKCSQNQVQNSGLSLWLSMSPMFIWIFIFFTRPHKEERFLYPIYPFFALGGAVAVIYIESTFCTYFSSKKATCNLSFNCHYRTVTVVFTTVFTLLSLSRIFQLYEGYHAPIDVYLELNKIAGNPDIHTLSPDKSVNVCVGKEWYRFPNSFFLPDKNWHLRFLQSDFKGQLPKPYYPGAGSTSTIPSHMNNMNKEEPTRYFNVSKCHYLIDLDIPTETELEPRYSEIINEWKVLSSYKFLHSSKSHRIYRAFYIPFISRNHCTYVNYNLLISLRNMKTSRN